MGSLLESERLNKMARIKTGCEDRGSSFSPNPNAIPQGWNVSTKNKDILWVKMAGDKDSNKGRGA